MKQLFFCCVRHDTTETASEYLMRTQNKKNDTCYVRATRARRTKPTQK